MKEKIKVTGYGFLHNKEYGVYGSTSGFIKKNHEYDKELDQYRIGNQWLIPFHRYE